MGWRAPLRSYRQMESRMGVLKTSCPDDQAPCTEQNHHCP